MINRKSTRQRPLLVEQLESRVVLDGNVSAFVSGGSLFIRGDSAANEIRITQQNVRSFTVASRDGQTTINGQSGPLTFSGVGEDLEISLGNGNDIVEVSGTPAWALWVVDRLVINTGSGADQVLINKVHALRLYLDTVTGDDTVNFGNGGARSGITVTKEAVILTGSGQDDARIHNSWFKRQLTLNMGNNNDETSLENVASQKRSTLNGGSGNDRLNRENIRGKYNVISYERFSNNVTAPAPTGLTANPDSGGVTEDATPNTATGNVLNNDTGGAGTKSVTAVNGAAGNVGTNVNGANGFGTFNITSTGQFTYTLDNNNAVINGLNAGQTRTDTATYTVTAGGQTSTATLTVTITGVTDGVNDPPVRTGGSPAAISVNEDSANTTAVTLGLSGLTYGPGGGTDESSQTLTFRVTVIPAFIEVFKADGTTEVNANDTVTLAELQGLTYKTLPNATGTANLTWTVQDSGGTAGGGNDTLTETLSIAVNPINDAPARTAGTPAAISVNEDSANTTAVTLGLSGLTYGPGGGAAESSQTLTFRVTVIPAFIEVFKADGTTEVNANDTVTLAELQGLTYKTLPNATGTGNLTWTVQDSGGTANGGVDTLTETLSITVNQVNDAPARTAGTPAAISVNEDSANTTAVTLGLSGLTYGPGGGTAESTQTLTFRVTVIPAFIEVFKADGTTEVNANDTVTLAELQGLTYKTLPNATGTGNLTWTVQDTGGTANGGVDTLTETLSITVNPINDAPARTAGSPAAISVDEDSANTTAVTLGLTGLTYGPGGGADESTQTLTFTVTVIPAFIEVFKADGTTEVNANDTVTLTELQNLTYKTLPNANGTGNLTWTVQDSGGTANGGVNTLTETLSITVNPVDDAPLAAVPDPGSVTEDATPGTATGNVLDNDTGGEESKAVTEVNGNAANIGTSVNGANGFGTFTIEADGSYTYTLDNTNTEINNLNDGEIRTDSVTYTVGSGSETDTATLTITITGVTDP